MKYTIGDLLIEGNANDYKRSDSGSEVSEDPTCFKWKGGSNRQTTGIWMWSEPIVRQITVNNNGIKEKEDVAILLMDTQGMFDNQTTMTLTAQIFGLSTIISSYQVNYI